MKQIMEVRLQKIKLYGFHGLDAGEEVTGGEFEVNLAVFYIPDQLPVTTIDQTVDYTVLLNIIRKRMAKPAQLLESLAMDITGEIFAKFPVIEEVDISITKLHPPIKNFEGSVSVGFKLKRN